MKAVNERAEAYVLKPFEVTELLETIARLLIEKTSEYLRLYTEVAQAKGNTPEVTYLRQNGDACTMIDRAQFQQSRSLAACDRDKWFSFVEW